MKTNYILIDYENTQPKSLDALRDIPFKAKIFLGSHQSKLPLELVQSLQRFGENVEYIQIEGNGHNALDFHICYYLGLLTHQDRNGYFHIISKDTGFDLIIKHLRAQKIACQRSPSIEDIPMIKAQNVQSAQERLSLVVANLTSRKSSRPKRLATLRSTINALFQKKLADQDLDHLIELLKLDNLIKIENESITYLLPE